MNMIVRGTLILVGVSCWAGDLTIEGNLNVTSNLTTSGSYIKMGANATSAYTNTFVWSDGTSFGSTLAYQFSAFARNGFRFSGGPIYGNGEGLTNLNLATAMPASITSDKLAAGSVGTNNAVQSEWNAWASASINAHDTNPTSHASSFAGKVDRMDTNGWTVTAHGAWITAAQVPAQTQQVYVATAGAAGVVTGSQSNIIASALQPASTNGWVVSAHSNLLTTNGNGSALSGVVKSSDTNGWTVSAHGAWITAAQVPAQTQQVYVATAGTAGTVTGVQSQLLTSALQPASIINLVPYTGAASSVNLGTNSMTAKLFIGDGSGLTNLSLVATLVANSVTTDKISDGAVTGGKIASGVINSGHLTNGAVTVAKLNMDSSLNMNMNRVTNLGQPVNDGDAVTKSYLRSVLLAIPPQGDLSMGSFTNGAPASFPLSL